VTTSQCSSHRSRDLDVIESAHLDNNWGVSLYVDVHESCIRVCGPERHHWQHNGDKCGGSFGPECIMRACFSERCEQLLLDFATDSLTEALAEYQRRSEYLLAECSP
jgi:hypothetical protein